MLPTTRTWHDYVSRVPFRLGVVTNEISEDIERALEVADALGIRDVELNSILGRPVTDLSDAEVQRVRDLIRARDVRVSLITDAAFKAATLDAVPRPGEPETTVYRTHRQILERAIALAHHFGTDRVRVFAFRRPLDGIAAGTPGWHPSRPPTDAELDAIVRGLRPLCDLAEREGITLLVENVRYSYADTGAHTRLILDAVGSDRLRLIWDVANAFVSGEPSSYPEGYHAVRPYVAQVHVKDARFLDRATGATAWERIGAGEVDLAGQVHALVREAYAGVVSLETHWHLDGDSGERSTFETWRGLSEILDRVTAFSVNEH